MHKWKYLVFLVVPVTGVISLLGSGWWTLTAVVFAYGFIPLAELLMSPDKHNLSAKDKSNATHDRYFDLLIYLVLPLYIALLALFLVQLSKPGWTPLEVFGKVFSFGMMTGIMAINLGHELGHRRNVFERFLGESLLVLAFQAHFLPYHNHGHHRNVATPDDPATARKNEAVYLFWLRSQVGSYFAAWHIEFERLRQKDLNPWRWQNRMLRYTVGQFLLAVLIWQVFGLQILGYFFVACVIGMLLLETVNYIEHYGLLRRRQENGKYERVTPLHSWNSDHILGRLMLFELSRHSDHHANPGKHYQILDSYEESPQMPTGYPGMMLLSLVPPLFFHVMNRRVDKLQSEH